MFGPGEYRPDPSAGITAPADLPQPEIVPYSRNDLRQSCPRCGHSAYRDKQSHRTLHDLGNLDLWCPRDLVVTYAQHYCTKCRKYFNADLADLAPPGGQYTHRVIDLAVRLVVEDGWKRNKKVAIKPLLQVLTVLHLDFCYPTHHSPSWLGFVRHDARLHASTAFFSIVCVVH